MIDYLRTLHRDIREVANLIDEGRKTEVMYVLGVLVESLRREIKDLEE